MDETFDVETSIKDGHLFIKWTWGYPLIMNPIEPPQPEWGVLTFNPE